MCIIPGKLEGKRKSKTPEVDLLLRDHPPNPSFVGNAVQISDVAIIINTFLILILFIHPVIRSWASQVVLVVRDPLANAGDLRDVSLIPGSGKSFGGWHGNLLQFSCLENPMDRGAWPAIVYRFSKNQTWLKWLSCTSGYTHFSSKIFFVSLSSFLLYSCYLAILEYVGGGSKYQFSEAETVFLIDCKCF